MLAAILLGTKRYALGTSGRRGEEIRQRSEISGQNFRLRPPPRLVRMVGRYSDLYSDPPFGVVVLSAYCLLSSP